MLFKFIEKILKYIDVDEIFPKDKSLFDIVTDYFANNGFAILVMITTVYVFQHIIKKIYVYVFITILLITISSKPTIKKKLVSIFVDNDEISDKSDNNKNSTETN